MDNVHRGNRKRRAIKFDEIRGFLPRLGEKGLMRPIARPEKEISKCNIPWYSVTREQRPSEKEGKIRKRERVRLLPRLNIGAPTSSLYPSISPLDPPRQSFEPGNPAVLLPPPSLPPSLPLPLLGGRNLLDNCYLHFYPIEEKISNKVGGKRRLEEKKRKNARPSLPQLCLAIHTFQSSYFHRNLEYPSRTNERFVGSKNSAIPSSFFFFLLF